MIYKTLAGLAAVALFGAGLMGPARPDGLHKVRGGAGLVAAHAGVPGGTNRGPPFVGRPLYAKRPFAAYRSFEGQVSGISAFYAYGPPYASCWTWLPTTKFGWRRTWVCNWPYGLGYAYY